MTTPTCPECGSTALQISYPTWYRFAALDGPLDGTTLVDVDVEATAYVHCESCGDTRNAKHYYAED